MSTQTAAEDWFDVTEDTVSELTDDQIEDVVKHALKTIEGDFSTADLRLLNDLSGISSEIKAVRMEIAAVRPDEISAQHIPKATDELDAIVAATEDATNSIMEAAEQIEAVAEAVGGEHGDKLGEVVTGIYEACSFQDITGQRISKVVNALHHIEDKIGSLVESFAAEIEEYKRDNPSPETPDETATGDEADLLNGPQLQGEGQSQEEIDALLASFD